MRAPVLRLFKDELIVDSFAGGGGASLGIEAALGRSPDIAINHDHEALAMHAVNHPDSKHLCEDVWKVDPVTATAGRRIGLMWLSPDCKHFSKAKGGKPVEKKIRGLAWSVFRWIKPLGDGRPRVIVLENVEEFEDWGPLLEDGRPCPARRGLTFRRFVRQLERCGYTVEVSQLVAADYGSPTTRKRLFLIARCDGLPIVWPTATHSKKGAEVGLLPWRTAAECIDFDLPCPSIFERKKELATNTKRRIARGVQRYVIDAPTPFVIPTCHTGDARTHSLFDPLTTITGDRRGHHALVEPFLVRCAHGEGAGKTKRWGRGEHPLDEPLPTAPATNDFALLSPYITRIGHTGSSGGKVGAADDPLSTITSKAEHLLTVPTLIQTGYGERKGQAPRTLDLFNPLGTVVGGGQKHAVVAAFLAKHNAGHEATGQQLGESMHTVTGRDTKAVVTSSLVKFKGTSRDGQPIDQPLHTIQAGGFHYAEVRAFMTQFYGEGGGQEASLAEPARTIRAKACLALVTVAGVNYAISDIGMRMLQPRELFRAQGFPDSYKIDTDTNGRAFTKSAQVRMCGNSVCPPVAAAIVRAQFMEAIEEQVA